MDDEPNICRLIQDVAEEEGFEVTVAYRASEFKAVYESVDPTVIALDLMIPDEAGIHLLKFLKERSCTARIVVISGLDRRMRQAADRLGDVYGLDIVANLQKPVRLSTLRDALTAAGEHGKQ